MTEADKAAQGAPTLRGLVAAAHANEQFPPVRVLAGNTLYVGYLGTKEQEAERFAFGLGEQLFNGEGPRKSAEAEEVYPRATARAEHLFRAARDGDFGEDSFTLLNCQIWAASGGGGVEVAAVTVPYAAVDGWWLGSAKRLASKGGGAGLFAGLLIPLPN
jgi:hypothetical protein